ncbi:SRPBCC domain-containing protein [Planosporangium thailandense]|uniref:SRPBCC domain-containing protein n=1 Tax=Planosporangium thailandense TaxID=765197 RepID=A0ABX0XU54_9ACTN|nr:SRPBCC family protein [Planosporangium thailandense]NJC68749.1 SRPBCC domain-containing protein [Planosporangium thailandense]
MRVSKSVVTIDAPRETVWTVLTEPRYVKQWQYGSDLQTDWSVGSPIRFTTEWEGNTFEQRGQVLAVDAPRELRYSLFAPRPGLKDRPENRFTMVYSLTEDAGRTRVTFTQEDPRPGAGGEQDAEEGENPVLAALKSLCESLVA